MARLPRGWAGPPLWATCRRISDPVQRVGLLGVSLADRADRVPARRQRQAHAALPRRREPAPPVQPVRPPAGVPDYPPPQGHRLTASVKGGRVPPSDHPFQVWIATDDTQTVVALAPLNSPERRSGVSGGTSPPEAVPVAPAGTNVAGLVVLAALVFLGTLGLCLWRAPLLVIFFLIALTVGVGLTVVLSKPSPARVVAPEIASSRRSTGASPRSSRATRSGLVELAERAGRALPALSDVVDPVEAGQSLAEALWVGADVLSRREQLRPPEPRSQPQPISTTGRAADALSAQREVAKGAMGAGQQRTGPATYRPRTRGRRRRERRTRPGRYGGRPGGVPGTGRVVRRSRAHRRPSMTVTRVGC